MFIAAEYKSSRHSTKFYISEVPVQNSPSGMLIIRVIDEGDQLRAQVETERGVLFTDFRDSEFAFIDRQNNELQRSANTIMLKPAGMRSQ